MALASQGTRHAPGGRMTRASLSIIGLLLVAGPALAQPFETRWRDRVAQFERENATLPADARTVVLLGSSSMEGWRYSDRVSRYLPAGHRYLNRGISGDGIGAGSTGVGNRLESSAFQCRPGHIFLLNGHNSIGATGGGLESTARIYRDVVRRLRERLPDVTLVLVTCQPTSGQYASMAPHLVRLNERIRAIAQEHGCGLLDLHARLVSSDGRSPRPGLSSDGLHMSNEGYRLFGEEMARFLSGAVTPPPPTTTPEPEPTPPSETVYVVRAGDTLGKIARRFHTTTAKLADFNGITNANLIHVGQRIRIPPTGGFIDALPGS
jgi:lysophospholipase L1-like esterase